MKIPLNRDIVRELMHELHEDLAELYPKCIVTNDWSYSYFEGRDRLHCQYNIGDCIVCAEYIITGAEELVIVQELKGSRKTEKEHADAVYGLMVYFSKVGAYLEANSKTIYIQNE